MRTMAPRTMAPLLTVLRTMAPLLTVLQLAVVARGFQFDEDVEAFGAKADGKAFSGDAFDKAITACSAAGGGVVHARGGVYITGMFWRIASSCAITLYCPRAPRLAARPDGPTDDSPPLRCPVQVALILLVAMLMSSLSLKPKKKRKKKRL